jgi:hypothetical protein
MPNKKSSKSPAFPPIRVLPEDAKAIGEFALDDGGERVKAEDVDYSGTEEEDEMDDADRTITDEDSDSDVPMDKSELDAAAQLLLSVSPRIMPMRPRSLSHLEPLQSLADAAFGQPKTSDVEKLRSCLQGISRSSGMGSLLAFNSNGNNANKKKGAGSNASSGTKIKFTLSSRSNSSESSRSSNSKRGKKRKQGQKSSGSEAGTKRKRPHGYVLPSTLKDTKYAKDYNLDGRIGIYTPEQRAKLLEKFRKKRRNRVWFKKVRYGCRKNLADRRLRIKGRFVRADSQEYKDYFAKLAREAEAAKKANPMKSPELKLNGSSEAVTSFSLQVNTDHHNKVAASKTARKSGNIAAVHPKMSPTAFSILANSNGRPRAASTLT